MCMSTPSAPAPTPLPQVAQEQDAAVTSRLNSRKRQATAMSGYKGTVLQGALGEVGQSTTGTLLGGGA